MTADGAVAPASGVDGIVQPARAHLANNLDFMRFAAALSVLISHCYPVYGQRFDMVQHWTGWLTLGGVAVAVFFVMSGFLIAQSWARDPNAFRFLRNRARLAQKRLIRQVFDPRCTTNDQARDLAAAPPGATPSW